MAPDPLSSASGAMVPAAAANSAPGAPPSSGAPCHVGSVVLSFNAGNYTKWAIYMRASLGRVGLIGHVDDTIAAAPTNADWAALDYTVLNVMHAANKASKAIYLDFDFRQLVQGASSITEYCRS
jgi:hypothetical protein